VLQTLLDGDIRGERATLTGGATIKYCARNRRNERRYVQRARLEDALDAARDQSGETKNAIDVDVDCSQISAACGAALALKNLTSPAFPTIAGSEIRLPRLCAAWRIFVCPSLA
jgi:hypothetical protein